MSVHISSHENFQSYHVLYFYMFYKIFPGATSLLAKLASDSEMATNLMLNILVQIYMPVISLNVDTPD